MEIFTLTNLICSCPIVNNNLHQKSKFDLIAIVTSVAYCLYLPYNADQGLMFSFDIPSYVSTFYFLINHHFFGGFKCALHIHYKLAHLVHHNSECKMSSD